MGSLAPGMGDQHEEAAHTQDIQHSASSDQEEEDDDEEDGGLAEPYCLSTVTIGETLSTAGEPIDDGESVPKPRGTEEPATGRFISSVSHKPRKRCSVLCTVYCVESDLSGDLPPLPPAEYELQRPLADSTPRSSMRGTSELPLSPGGLELELSPSLISSLADGGHKVMMSCRVCLEDKSIKPLPCCKKGVCEECLKRYLSSQVTRALCHLCP